MKPKENDFKVKVRLMKDNKNYRWWYEEWVEAYGGQWVEIKETNMACEGNATGRLHTWVQKRRNEIRSIYVSQIGEEKEFDLSF